MKNNVHRVAFLGVCTAVALILAYVEMLLPPLFPAVPGIKLGLPNIILVFILYRFGVRDAATVSLMRLLLVWFLFGSTMSFLYSLAGAALSLLVMALLRKADLLSPVGVSVAGAILHNVGQILVAILLLGTTQIAYYLIVLTVTGIIAGVVIGFCGGIAIKTIKI